MTNALQDVKSQEKFSSDVIMTLRDLLLKESEIKINEGIYSSQRSVTPYINHFTNYY